MAAAKRNCKTAGCSKRAKYLGRVYLGHECGRCKRCRETPAHGRDCYEHLGYYCTERHRREAQEQRRAELRADAKRAAKPTAEKITCDGYAARYLDWYEEEYKGSSLDTARQQLRRFRRDFGARLLRSIERDKAIDWSKHATAGDVSRVRAMFNRAVDEELIDRNPFRKLGKRGKGRAALAPPTVKQLDGLLDACDALDGYASQMRALIVVGAYTGMRPGELFELRWSDVRFEENRIVVSRRLYRGLVDTPKNGAAKTIALPPPAKDALMDLPLTRDRMPEGDELVFLSKQGKQLTAPTVCQYWAVVRAAAGLDSSYDLYRCTKHLAVHRLFKLGLSKRAIAAQMGWSEAAVDSLLRTYGHADVVALEEVDALYESEHGAPAPVE